MAMARVTAILMVAGVLAAGCTSTPADDAGGDQPAPAPVSLLTDLEPGDAAAVGQAVNGFGFDLFGQLATGDENAVTSPLSAAVLLAMVLAGAGGDTAEAMAEALHLNDPRDVRVGELLAQLAGSDDVTLSVANALWADPEIPFEDDYVGFVTDGFGATLENADLGSPGTAEAIDAWADQQTEGRIDAIAEDLGLPNPDVALVLLNAVYFLGEWTTQFDPDDTTDQPFTFTDGTEADVPLMQLLGQELAYAQRDGYQLLRLPYGEQGRYGMEVLLPDPDSGLPELLDTLDLAEWQAAVGSLSLQTVDEVALPRFELEWGEQLNESLEQLGMSLALDPSRADFTAMSPADLYLDQVVQKTYIRVDEQGTEAAAVTGGGMGITSLQPQVVFRADRPFAFTISDAETGTILFLGAVADPRG
jgi:serpin B